MNIPTVMLNIDYFFKGSYSYMRPAKKRELCAYALERKTKWI